MCTNLKAIYLERAFKQQQAPYSVQRIVAGVVPRHDGLQHRKAFGGDRMKHGVHLGGGLALRLRGGGRGRFASSATYLNVVHAYLNVLTGSYLNPAPGTPVSVSGKHEMKPCM